MGLAIFVLASLLAIAGAIGVITFREAIHSVLSLVVNMLSIAVLFLLLDAQFLFIVQVIVYAGAVMVLFLFVVALLGPQREIFKSRIPVQIPMSLLSVAILAIFAYILLARAKVASATKPLAANFGTVQWLGDKLFVNYLYPVELTSLLLLAAAMGALYLSRGERR